MASLRNRAKVFSSDLADGIGWVALWKVGCSWFAERLFEESYNYDSMVLEMDQGGADRLREIVAADPNAVLLNGHYSNIGCTEDGVAPDVDTLTEMLRWQYEECNPLASNWEVKTEELM